MIGRIGSCVPWQTIAVALAPHCWNATSFADPEYVMDLGSPNAFCAFAIAVFASCAIAFPQRYDTQIPARASFFIIVIPFKFTHQDQAKILHVLQSTGRSPLLTPLERPRRLGNGNATLALAATMRYCSA